eukprot:6177900-Pleurochrysis_carterae.AAC.2
MFVISSRLENSGLTRELPFSLHAEQIPAARGRPPYSNFPQHGRRAPPLRCITPRIKSHFAADSGRRGPAPHCTEQ